MQDKNRDNYFIYLFEISPFIIGLSSIYTHLFFGAALAIGLLIYIHDQKHIHIYRNPSLYAGGLILIGGFLSIPFGMDPGTSFEGLLILLSGLIFTLFIMQFDPKDREMMLRTLPETGAILVLLCGFLYLFPVTKDFLFVSNRLNGFFQYANTMALYLLLCLTYFLLGQDTDNGSRKNTKKGRRNLYVSLRRYLLPGILMAGILWTGSRSTFVLMLAVILYAAIRRKELRLSVGILTVLILGLAVLYVAVSGRMSSIGRFLTISGKESTLIGRFLYWEDALPVILKHPFGLGYLGYDQMQASFQHGLYAVKYVHNEYLQCFLDYGWIAGVGFLWLLIHNLRKSRGIYRIMLIVMMLHMLMDMDLQFFPMIYFLLITMSWTEGKHTDIRWVDAKNLPKWKKAPEPEEIHGKRIVTGISAAMLVGILLSIWVGAADLIDYAGHPDVAQGIYPFEYNYALKQMYAATSYEEAEPYANQVLALNPYNAMAYGLKANAAKDRHDYKEMVKYLNLELEHAPYQMNPHKAAVTSLIEGIEYCDSEKKATDRKLLVDTLKQIPKRLEQTQQTTNPLAYQIKDKPVLKLSDEVMKYIESL
ncbi:MAG: O-antigen ligase family protein [Lachnospiraceae bacterium]|nr:O-antigen ligase family protein [Lachnospiraceae bacterium]